MSERTLPAALLFGAPGVGKGTQGGILGRIPGFFHLSVGDVFRSLDIGSAEGLEVYQYSSRGDLVPDELTVKIWKKSLDAYIALSWYKPREDLLILDGIPRTVSQAEILIEYVEVHAVINLVSSDEEEMVHRIKRRAIRENRPDDAQEEVIRRRLDVYRRDTSPVLDAYPGKIISQVEALGSPAEVLQATLNCLIPVQNELFQRHVYDGL